ncbi:MAG: class I SAM-dependent methyltransferase [Pseudomonadota bacterium]
MLKSRVAVRINRAKQRLAHWLSHREGVKHIIKEVVNNDMDFPDTLRRLQHTLKNDITSSITALKTKATPANPMGALAMNTQNAMLKTFEVLEPAGVHQPAAKTFSNFKETLLETDLSDYVARDTFPLPQTKDREGYCDDRHFDYWLGGLMDYLSIKKVLRDNAAPLALGDAVFEMGCASGRVLRHFRCQEKDLDVWGSDINGFHIEWARRYLPGSMKIFQNTILPSLPVPDKTMSLVYAFSVFTHLDEFELGWLAELSRILKPGGIAYLTVLGDSSWKSFNPASPRFPQVKWAADQWIALNPVIEEYDVGYDLFSRDMPHEKTVFRWKTADIYNTVVFHSTAYIENTWGRFFKILDIVPAGHEFQDVVVLQKPF